MLSESANNGTASSAANKPRWDASRIVRRVHLYLGLFLAPWMFVYAVSTMVMNHREFVQSFYPAQAPGMITEREMEYSHAFPADATPQQIGKQILQDIGLDGTHRVNGGKDGKPIVIDRQHAWAPRRITWNSNTEKLVIERQQFRSPNFLERMHFRGGFQQPTLRDGLWAVLVDVACVGLLIWIASGLVMWWRLARLRMWGAVAVGGGILSFVLLVWRL